MKMLNVLLIFLSCLFCFSSAELRCVPGVKRFSSSVSRSHYYECEKDSIFPVLKECPDHHVYLMKQEKCLHEREKVPETLLQKSLGQNVQLGAFYNGRKGIYYPEASLWKRQTIADHLYKEDFLTTTSSVEILRTLRERMDYFHFDANVKGFLFGGLVSVKASAGFTTETATLSDELSVQLMFETTKYTKAIDKYLALDYSEECNSPHYTHVVTEVTYGLAAYFNFLRQVQSDENQWDLEVDLTASIDLIPGLGITADIGAELSEGQKNVLNTTTLKMYGDFSPSDPDKPLPTNFTEAVHFYHDLPSMMGSEANEWKDTTILDVRLTPIEDFCKNQDDFQPPDYQPAGESVMEKISEMMDQLETSDTVARELLAQEPSIRFNPVRENFNLFHQGVRSFQLATKAKIAELFPQVLAGNLGEDDLLNLYNNYMSSPFEAQMSELFLRARHREVNAIQFLMNDFPKESNIGVVDYESANDVEYIFKREQVIILDFHILSSKSLTQSYLDGNPVDESDLWYNDIEENAYIGSLLRNLSAFSLANIDMPDRGYLIKLSLLEEDQKTNFYTISALRNGEEIANNNFVVPPNPSETMAVPLDLTHNSFKINLTKLNEFVTGAIITVMNLMNFESPPLVQTWNFSPDTEVGSEHLYEFAGLRPTHLYSVNVKYTTKVGFTPSTLESEVFTTLATSAPQNLEVKGITSTSLELSWYYPEVVAEDLGFKKEDYQYYVTDGVSPTPHSTPNLSYRLSDLVPGTRYELEVRAFYPKNGINSTNIEPSPPARAVVFTSPLPPSNIQAVEIGEHSVTLQATPPGQIGEGAEIMYYVVEATGNGESKQHIAKSELWEITDLARGTEYSFTMKVVTTDSESDFSDAPLTVTTKYIKTEMEEAEDEVNERLADISQNIFALSSFCAYKGSTNENGVTVTYDGLTTSGTSVSGTSLDIGSGTFTAGATGSYQVSVSLRMVSSSGQQHRVWVRHNGENVAESLIHSELNQSTPGEWSDGGSKSLYLQLVEDDTLSLYHEVEGGTLGLQDITFCVSLANM